MPLRSGIAAQFGVAEETAWGTYTVPTRFLEFPSESMALTIERIESQALRAGSRSMRSDRWAAGAKSAGGTVQFELADRGFGLILKHLLGSVAITTPDAVNAPTARDHTVTPGDLAGLSLTMQVGRPDTAGVVHPFSYPGCKVASWELSNSVNGLLGLSANFDGADESTAQALAAVSYPATQGLLSYAGGLITVGGSSFDLQEFSLSGDNGLKTDRHHIRQSQLKKEQHVASWLDLTGTLSAEFDGLTAYNRFVNGTVASVTALWEGATIATTFKYGLLVTLPAVRFDGATPNVSGPDILTQSLPFKALSNGTDPVATLRYRTTDTAS